MSFRIEESYAKRKMQNELKRAKSSGDRTTVEKGSRLHGSTDSWLIVMFELCVRHTASRWNINRYQEGFCLGLRLTRVATGSSSSIVNSSGSGMTKDR